MTFTDLLDRELAKARADSPDADLSITLLRVRDGVTLYESNADAAHTAASTMKLPLVLAAYREAERGRLDLQAPVRIRNSFTSQVGGTFGVEQEDDSDTEVWDRMGQEVPLAWLCRRCIIRSSNLATNLVLEQVGLAAVVDVIAAAAADGVVVARGIGDFAAGKHGEANLVTTRGLSAILLGLARDDLASSETSAAVLEVLSANEMGMDVRSGLPEGTYVAHKNGWVVGAVHDSALFRTPEQEDYILTVATTTDWPEERAHQFIGGIAAQVWEQRDHLGRAS